MLPSILTATSTAACLSKCPSTTTPLGLCLDRCASTDFTGTCEITCLSAVTSPGPDTKALWECYRAGCTTSAPRRLLTPSRDDSHNRTRTISDDFWLLPEVAAPFEGTERVMAQLKRWRAGATFGLMENKLLSHSLLEALNVPQPAVLYGAFATKSLGAPHPRPPQLRTASL